MASTVQPLTLSDATTGVGAALQRALPKVPDSSALQLELQGLLACYFEAIEGIATEPLISWRSLFAMYLWMIKAELALCVLLISLPFLIVASIAKRLRITKGSLRPWGIGTLLDACRTLHNGEIPGFKFLTPRVAVDFAIVGHVRSRLAVVRARLERDRVLEVLANGSRSSARVAALRDLRTFETLIRQRFAAKVLRATTSIAIFGAIFEYGPKALEFLHTFNVNSVTPYAIAASVSLLYAGVPVASGFVRAREVALNAGVYTAERRFERKCGLAMPRAFPADIVIWMTLFVLFPLLTYAMQFRHLAAPTSGIELATILLAVLPYEVPLGYALARRYRLARL